MKGVTLRELVLDSTEDLAKRAGAGALEGFEYQIDVSIWLALDLILASKLTDECVLEPISQEDFEADLHENEPGRVTTVSQVGGYRLIVQAKLRRGDAWWTAGGLRRLLTHGGEARRSAAELLQEDPSARYLLVTSAGLNGEAAGLRVRRAGGKWPEPSRIPASLTEALGASLGGRLAVIAGNTLRPTSGHC